VAIKANDSSSTAPAAGTSSSATVSLERKDIFAAVVVVLA